MMKHVLLLAALAACGGHKKADTTPPPDNDPTNEQPTNAGGGGDGNMIPPEKMDEVAQDLKRKNMIVSQCLATAMEAGEVKKGTHGHITFEIKIGTDGHTTSVKVLKSDIDAQSVIGCAQRHVEGIGFPTLPKPYETSYTFAMEAN